MHTQVLWERSKHLNVSCALLLKNIDQKFRRSKPFFRKEGIRRTDRKKTKTNPGATVSKIKDKTELIQNTKKYPKKQHLSTVSTCIARQDFNTLDDKLKHSETHFIAITNLLIRASHCAQV